eukprot:TRINITY_DN13011_c0_g1_i4.p2 TRINITY_DN13011_c0_g1~~TRINITY_DN13011_c0_g1_i4.p2  ORF type:complete len:181 (+),score=61.75 TRINITY_DN13011_c0_g1_i4:98-640(+)
MALQPPVAPYAAGDTVEALWEEGGEQGWYSARVAAVHGDGSVDVDWGDGTATTGLQAALVRPALLSSRKRQPSGLLGAGGPSRLAPGDQVEALWGGDEEGEGREWFAARVLAVHDGGARVDVDWGDGTMTAALPRADVRQLAPGDRQQELRLPSRAGGAAAAVATRHSFMRALFGGVPAP